MGGLGVSLEISMYPYLVTPHFECHKKTTQLVIEIHARFAPSFWIGTEKDFKLTICLLVYELQMMCHTVGIYLKLSTYHQKPLFWIEGRKKYIRLPLQHVSKCV